MSEAQISIKPTRAIELLGSVGSPLIVISELIKNSFDASADNIQICYDTSNNTISIIDDGDGFSDQDILLLTQIGSSRKKMDEFYTHNSHMYTGSKGLGLLSAFSLCTELRIITRNEANAYEIIWDKSGSSFTYDNIDSQEYVNTGSIVQLLNIDQTEMSFLVSDIEIKKLQHISTYFYKNDLINFPNITLKLDDGDDQNLLYTASIDKMLYDISFEYTSTTSTLSMMINVSDELVDNRTFTITSFDLDSINKLLKDTYGINNIIKSRFNTIYPTIENYDGIPSFEGRIIAYYGKRRGSGSIHSYGYGVNIYINDFALYNYLDDSNDWLELANFSQTRKSTTFKPHNVYGYVNFPEFDENKENLKISNERADFIIDYQHHQIMYILKGVVLHMLFNIDINLKAIKSEAKKSAKTDESTQSSYPESEPQGDTQAGEKENNDTGSTSSNDAESGYERSDDGSSSTGSQTESDNQKEGTPSRRNFSVTFLRFTHDQQELIEATICTGTNHLNQKIIETISELSQLSIRRFKYSGVALYRILLETTMLYFLRNFGGGTIAEIKDLSGTINRIINQINQDATQKKDRILLGHIPQWKHYIKDKQLILILNNYVHHDIPIDINIIQNSWEQMRNFISFCLTGNI